MLKTIASISSYSANDHIYNEHSLALDKNGNIYIAYTEDDINNNQVSYIMVKEF